MARGRKIHLPDPFLLGISFALIFLGILILASVSASFSLQSYGTTFYFFNHQLLFGLLPGLAVGLIAYLMPLEFIKKWSFPALIFTLFLLLLVFLPGIGSDGKVNRWIFLGPFSFQPSELLKLTFILYLASWLSSRVGKGEFLKMQKKSLNKHLLNATQTLLPFLLVIGSVGTLLVLQPDISTLGVIAITAVFMYFVAGTPGWHMPAMIIAGLGVLYVLIQLAPYRLSRLAVFLDPSLDPLGQGYQIKQALIGIGSGGLTGAGLGLSFQKYGFLPEPISDSIFAIVAEELGFIGAGALIILFLLFMFRSLQLARCADDLFSRTAIVGIASWITMQAFVNIGAITGVLPLTGIPLPFISYGGSALVTELVALGVLLKLTARQKSYTIG